MYISSCIWSEYHRVVGPSEDRWRCSAVTHVRIRIRCACLFDYGFYSVYVLSAFVGTDELHWYVCKGKNNTFLLATCPVRYYNGHHWLGNLGYSTSLGAISILVSHCFLNFIARNRLTFIVCCIYTLQIYLFKLRFKGFSRLQIVIKYFNLYGGIVKVIQCPVSEYWIIIQEHEIKPLRGN